MQRGPGARDLPEQGREFNNIVLSIYDSAIDPTLWPETLTRVARFIGGAGAFLFELQDMEGDANIGARYYSANYDQQKVNEYLLQHQDEEMRDQLIFAHHSKKSDEIALIGDQVLAPSVTELKQHDNVQTMQRFGILHRAGALLNKDIVYKDRFAVQFTPDQGPLTEEKALRSQMLMPHLAKALDIGRATMQLAERYNTLAGALDCLRVGVCILDRRGRVVLRNTEFNRQIDAFGTFRVQPDGKLSMSHEQHRAMLAARIADRTDAPFGGRPRKQAIIPTNRDMRQMQCVEVMPVESHFDFGGDLAGGSIVFSMDTSKNFEFDMRLIAHVYKLTQSEQAVLALLSEGHTNRTIADMRGTSVETVNVQVKAILSKMMADNRTQLIRIMCQTTNFLITDEAELTAPSLVVTA